MRIPPFRDISIKQKLTLINALVSGGALLLACIAFLAYELITFRQEMVRELVSSAQIIGANSRAALTFHDKQSAEETLAGLKAKEHIRVACIFTAEGAVFATYLRQGVSGNFLPSPPQGDSHAFEDDGLTLFYQIVFDGERIGTVYIQSDLDQMYSRLIQYAVIVLGVLIASSLVAVLLSAKLQRVISDPMLQLVQIAKSVSAKKDYSIRAISHRQDELGALIDGFNEMLAQIQTRDAALQTARNELEQRVTERTQELLQEILDRKRAERALMESEDRLRRVVTSAPIILWALDRMGLFTLLEGKGLEALGLKPGEVVGQSIFQVFRDAPQLLNDTRRAFAGETFISIVAIHGLFFEARYAPIRNRQGQIAGTTCVATDVTEREKAEKELRRAEERYRSLVHHAVYGICRTTPEGRFMDANPALISMLGYASAESLLRVEPATDLYRDTQEYSRVIDQILRAGRIDGMEVEWQRRDRTPIAVRLSGQAVRNDPSTLDGFEFIVEDITERRVLEQQLRQAQKMEAIGRLAGGIAHDFNNLLTVIIGYAGLLLARAEGKSPFHKEVGGIMDAGERASSLTRQLLAFSRRQVLQPALLNLNTSIKDMEKMLRRLIGEDITLKTALDPAIGVVKADAGQVEQVIMNLVVNARDAMPKGGTLTIETAHMDLNDGYLSRQAGVQPGSYVLLAVSDTGCGMDAETQAHIFEPFFTTKEQGKGTGLGLSTVYGIVAQSEGNIQVHSEPGRGATFKIYFPEIQEIIPAPTVSLTPVRPQGGEETVLLVEDEEDLRRLVTAILEEKGYTVLEARYGPEAIRMAEEHADPIHLLITDVIMPEISGHEVADRVTARHPETKVLYMSGYPDDAILDHGVLPQDTAFLQKPFNPEGLVRKVREVLDQHALSAPPIPQPASGPPNLDRASLSGQ